MKIKTSLKTGWWYTIQYGDSLYKIAQRYYGNGALWNAIYNYGSNRTIIGANPNTVYAGQRIELW